MYDDAGELLAFQGRAVKAHRLRYRTEGPRPIFRPWDLHDVQPDSLCIVEGPFDLFVVNRVVPTVAVLGIQPSPSQIEDLQKLVGRFRQTHIWFDRGALAEALDLQRKLAPFGIVDIILWDNEADPGACSESLIREVLEGSHYHRLEG